MLFIDKITTIFEQGIKNGSIQNKNAHDMALSFYYMMIGLSMPVKFCDEKEIDKVTEKCINVFIAGIKL